MPKEDPINLWVVDIKWSENLPNNAEGVTIESLQFWGPVASAHRDVLQEVLMSSMFISEGGYIIVENPDSTIPVQWSEDFRLGKIPGWKKDDSALVEILADAYGRLAPNLNILKKFSKNELLSWKYIGKLLNFDPVIIQNTPDGILNEWLHIVSKSSPWDINDLKKLAKKSKAIPFIAHWLGIETKAVKDFIQHKKWLDDSDYQNNLDEKLSKSHKKIRNGYDILFGGKSESIKDAAIREYEEETGYKLDKKYLVPLYVIYETKLTPRWIKYLKKRIIRRYSKPLWVQWKLSHSASEKEQNLKLILNKTIQQISDLFSEWANYKLWSRSILERLFRKNSRKAKLSSALLTIALIKRFLEDRI